MREKHNVYKIAGATPQTLAPLKIRKQAQGSNRRLTTPLNPFNVPQSNTTQLHNGDNCINIRQPMQSRGRKHFVQCDALHLVTCN